jgi:hypothetical protein
MNLFILTKIPFMNWSVIIPIGLLALVIIGFLIWKNIKDEKKIVNDLKNDYRKTKDEEGDTEIEDIPH